MAFGSNVTGTIEYGSIRLAYRESSGKGPVVVFIHGNSLSSRSFSAQCEEARLKGHRLLALDLPGHGESGRLPSYSASAYAGAIAAFHNALGLAKVPTVYVGWSLGGHMLMKALEGLTGIRGLVLFGAPPLGSPADLSSAFLPNEGAGLLFKAELAPEEATAFSTLVSFSGAPGWMVKDVERADPAARTGILADFLAGGFAEERAVVRNLQIPLALFHGEKDPLINADYIKALLMPTLWRGQVQVMPGAGHAPHLEAPAAFNALLLEFLRDIGHA